MGAGVQEGTADWDALEQGLSAGARIEVMQGDGSGDGHGGRSGHGRGHAGRGRRKQEATRKATWVTAVARRMDSIQD